MPVRQLDDVVKSPNDKRVYRAIQLDSGFRALLISDQTKNSKANDVEKGSAQNEKLSAAALSVGVGSFSDLPQAPGLAHFLEHMVFMGSEKFPDENEFDAYIKKHGGGSNAFTDCERTVFYFDINRTHLYEALDMFAQFFISPLMKKGSVDREIQAVDSEFDMALQSDRNRKEQFLGSLARDGHPMGKFMWGNKESLKIQPEKDGVDVYQVLREFHKKAYSSHYMALAIQSLHSLDTLQEWVEAIFSKVPNNQLQKVVFDDKENPFETDGFCKLYKAVPVKNVHQVEVTWSLPSLLKNYKVKPLHYIGWLVGHEGAGSILSYLKKRVWALSLCGGNSESGFEHNSTCAIFSISITLTELGMDHVFEVLTAVFHYLNMLRQVGPNRRVYDEICKIEANDFRWQEESDPADTVEKLAENMQLYPPTDYLTGELLLTEYDEDLIASCQNKLLPESASFLLYSKRFSEDGVCDKMEPWFRMPFSASDVPEHWLKAWKEDDKNPAFHLPHENTYIATDFTLRDADKEYTQYPEAIKENDQSRLWYCKDNKFNIPKAYLCFHLRNPMVSESATTFTLLDLFVRVLEHNLSEIAYAADVAQLSYDFTPDSQGLKMKLHGFNHKLPDLFRTVVDYIANFSCEQDVFEALADQQRRVYYNHYIKPKNMVTELRLSLLLEPYCSTIDRRQVLDSITVDMLLDFAKDFKSRMYVEGLVQGNITVGEAKELEKYLLDQLGCHVLPEEQRKKEQVGAVPAGEHYIRAENFNSADCNSVITNYYQHGPASLYESCLNELLITRMEEPCFDILRTKHQLGYVVFCTNRVTSGILGLSVTVCSQANKFPMSELDSYMEKFLIEFEEIMDKMTEDDFKTLVASLITLKQCEDPHLGEEVSRNWAEVTNQEYVFNRLSRQVEALEKMSLNELRKWYKDHVPAGGKHKKLSVQIEGNKDSERGHKRKRSVTVGSADDCVHNDSWETISDDHSSEDEENPCQTKRSGNNSQCSEGEEDSEEEEEEEDEEDSDVKEIDEADLGTPAEWNFLPLEKEIATKQISHIMDFHKSLTMFPPSKIV